MSVVWIVLVSLLGALLLYVGFKAIEIARIIRRLNVPGAPKRPADKSCDWVLKVIQDENGKVVSTEWVPQEWPRVYKANGIEHLAEHIDRLLAFDGWRAGVSIFTLDGQRGLGVDKEEGRLEAGIIFGQHEPSSEPAERKAREFFAARNLSVISDYLSPGPFPSRNIDWELPSDREALLEVVSECLSELSGVSHEEGLSYKFHGSPARPDPNDIPCGYQLSFRMSAVKVGFSKRSKAR